MAGLTVLVSDQVDAATLFWGIPKSHVVLVMRKGTTVERFPAVHQDGTYVRAVARFGLAFLNEAGVIRRCRSNPCGANRKWPWFNHAKEHHKWDTNPPPSKPVQRTHHGLTLLIAQREPPTPAVH